MFCIIIAAWLWSKSKFIKIYYYDKKAFFLNNVFRFNILFYVLQLNNGVCRVTLQWCSITFFINIMPDLRISSDKLDNYR